jgi:hypothetical protein
MKNLDLVNYILFIFYIIEACLLLNQTILKSRSHEILFS